MSFRHWLIIAALVSVGCLPPTPAVGQEKPPKEFDAATVEAWTKSHFQAGYMGLDANGDLAFAEHPGGLGGAVPAFRCTHYQQGFPASHVPRLPPPKVPFGLWLEDRALLLPGGPPVSPPGPVEVLAGLEHLTRLKLKGAKFQNADLEGLTELTSLTHLDLRGTWVSGPGLKHLVGLKGLTHLNLHDTPVPGPWLKYLAGLGQLTELSLDRVTDRDLKHIAGHKNLTRLSILSPGKRLPLTAEGLKHLAGHPRLTRLVLGVEDLTDEGWEQLRTIPGLTSLTLPAGKPTADNLKNIGEFKGLTSLSVLGWPTQAEGQKHLAGLTNLTRLETSSTPVTDQVMKHLAGLPKLATLRMGNESTAVEMTADGMKRLGELKGLTALSLGEGVRDEHLQHLAGLSNLARLELNCSFVEGDGLKHLGRLRRLTSLTLSSLWFKPENVKRVEALRAALPKCEIVVPGDWAR